MLTFWVGLRISGTGGTVCALCGALTDRHAAQTVHVIGDEHAVPAPVCGSCARNYAPRLAAMVSARPRGRLHELLHSEPKGYELVPVYPSALPLDGPLPEETPLTANAPPPADEKRREKKRRPKKDS